MRAFQFWILVLGSTCVSGLMIKQIFVSRSLEQEQRVLVDSQETVSTGPAWQKAWQKVAIHIYQSSRQDPAFAQVLKDEQVEIHENAGAGADSDTPSVPPASSKAPAAPLHPATSP